MCWAVPYYINSVYVLRIIVFAVGVYMHCIQCCNYCCLHHFEKKEEKTLFERVRLPEKSAIQKDKVWLGLSIVFIIAFQIFYVVYYQHTDIDDSYYLAQINTIIHTNKILAIDPASGIAELNFNSQYKMVSYEVLMSFIVRLFHVNTAFFMHTILPVFLIPVHYIVIYQIGKFISQRYAYHFVLLYSVFNLFSAYSGYSQGAFLL